MQAQDHEIRAWLGDQWGEAETDALVAAIQATGSDDEAEWVRVVAEHDGLAATDSAAVILDAAARDFDRAAERFDAAKDGLRGACRTAFAAGMRKADIARRAGVTRRTLDAWLGEGVATW